ncbi:hypothetical protein IQ270_13025 [Microcoleus sp. LEGE 07076]|uniref:hypothetical protein n=1 Tax=Microcoleus sp. LEGE 07076 TaxID=915322 RepID=UPI00187EF1F6|nr:hypothetical protein [Microcoleus sp. LEGE 07076]MBE9185595.1 hypothetical protein [Microcoleus sp. LEGE 07076]
MQLLEIEDGRVNFASFFAGDDRRLHYRRLDYNLVICTARDRPLNQFISPTADRAARGSFLFLPKFLKFNP